MKLYMTVRSPFARRIRLALRRASVLHTEVPTDVFHPSKEFLDRQPLATVPYIETVSGELIPDSQTILEFLDSRYASLVPTRTSERVLSTFSVGIMTATVAWFLESQRAAPSNEFQEEQMGIILRTLSHLNSHSSQIGQGLAFWDTAVALEYLNFRLPDLNWATRFENLAGILARAQQDKHFQETKPRL